MLDYDGTGLLLRFSEDATDSFASSSFYKLFLKRYVYRIDTGCVVFKPVLTYLDYKKVIELCRRQWNDLVVSDALSKYIDSKEMYVDSRSRLGVELKNHDPKLLEQYEQYKAAVDAAMVRPLRERQMWDSFFLCAMQKASNFSVPGSGKTASVLGMYAYLRSKELVSRILVVCPKNAFGSWMDEFAACFGDKHPLRVLNIHDPRYQSTKERRYAIRYEAGRCNLILVNYESVSGVEDALLELLGSQTMLVFDEVHKVKRVEGEYARHALNLAEKASYVVAMTGTPIPNTYLDVYNLLHILFPDEYDTFFDFSIPVLRKPTPQDIKEVNDKLQPFFCRTTKKQLGVPAANPDGVYSFPANSTENRLMQILQMKYKHNKLALLIRLLQLESNPKMLLNNLSLQDFQYLLDETVEVDEIDFVDSSEEIQQLIENSKTATKFDRCVELTQSLVSQKKTAIVWCIFVDSIRRLEVALEKQGIRTCCIYGEVPLEQRQELLNDFRSGKIQVLLTNPHTLAESVSLHSVCHDAIYFEYSYNLVHLLQSKDRIHRLGLPENQYTQYHFLQLNYQTDDGLWSLDDAVYQRLKEKEQTMLDAIDNHILESMPTSQEDLDLIFSKLF
jgi:SNF2 family DNA or RNA helicase